MSRRPVVDESFFEALAARFAVPAKCGVYLTKNEIVALARASEASLRINERRRMLGDVLHSAQTPGELRALVARLRAFCQMHLEDYAQQGALYPTSLPLLATWKARAQATIDWLDSADRELAAAGDDPPG